MSATALGRHLLSDVLKEYNVCHVSLLIPSWRGRGLLPRSFSLYFISQLLLRRSNDYVLPFVGNDGFYLRNLNFEKFFAGWYWTGYRCRCDWKHQWWHPFHYSEYLPGSKRGVLIHLSSRLIKAIWSKRVGNLNTKNSMISSFIQNKSIKSAMWTSG